MQPSVTARHPRFNLRHGLIAGAIIGMVVLGMILGALSRDATTSNPVGNAAQPAPVAQVAAQPKDNPATSIQRKRLIDLNTIYTPGDAAASTAKTFSRDWARFMEANLYLPESAVKPTRDFSREWQRFRSVNGADVIEAGPVISSKQQQFLEQNLYLPSDGVGFVDVAGQRDLEAPRPAVNDRKAYYEAALGEGWLANGKPADAVDTTYHRVVGSWVNEGSGEGWLANGKPVSGTTNTSRPSRRGASTLR